MTGFLRKSCNAPFMVEFDVQLYQQKLHLGHPPALNTQSTLKEALQLFLKKPVIPKIDLKLTAQIFTTEG